MSETDWNYVFDVVVIGSGAGGLSAAVVATDGGAKALVIEKDERFGGTSATSGGVVWIPNNGLNKALARADNVEDAAQYMREVAGAEVPADLLNAFLDRGPRMVQYMVERTDVQFNPVPYPDYQAELPGGRSDGRSLICDPFDGSLLEDPIETMHGSHRQTLIFGKIPLNLVELVVVGSRGPGWRRVVAGAIIRYFGDFRQRLRSGQSRYLTGGAGLVGRLKYSLEKRGVPVWRSTPMTGLIQDEDGQVVGVRARKDGRDITIRATGGVVIASGGFEHSAELRAKYQPKSPDPKWSIASPANTGDGLVAATQLGAKTERLDSAWRVPSFPVEGEDRARGVFFERALPGSIAVNQSGQRFTNESTDYNLFGQAMLENDRTDAGTIPTFILCDSRFMRRHPMGTSIPGIPHWMLPKSHRKIFFKAATIEQLAGKIGVPPQALVETVKRFNENARLGKDPDFHRGERVYDRFFSDASVKPDPNLHPLESAPFYALAVYPGDIGTNGGLVIDRYARVLDEQDRPIPGLYAAGNVTASVTGYGYPGGGATIGPAMTFGYVAAQHITRSNSVANDQVSEARSRRSEFKKGEIMTIAITGATGLLGSLTISALKRRGGAEKIVALVRDPSKVNDSEIETRIFDYNRPETLEPALAGVDTLIFISSSEVGQRVPQHLAVVAAAKAAGVHRIVYTSMIHADQSSISLAAEHLPTEEAIKASGLRYTIMRNAWYNENYLETVRGATQHGVIIGSYGEGRISAASRADYAQALAVVATTDSHDGQTYELAGDEGFTMPELAQEVSKQTGREIPYQNLPESDYAGALAKAGVPNDFAQFIANMEVCGSKGDLVDDSKQLSKLIGRPTTPISSTVAEALK